MRKICLKLFALCLGVSLTFSVTSPITCGRNSDERKVEQDFTNMMKSTSMNHEIAGFNADGIMRGESSDMDERVSYTKVLDSKNVKYTGPNSIISVKNFYSRIKISGNTEAIRSINAYLKARSDAFMKKKSAVKTYAKDMVKTTESNAVFYDTVSSYVTYNKNGIISIKIKAYWFAGGVSNTTVWGYTFDVKTGKRLYLKDVCEGSAAHIKNAIIDQVKANDPNHQYNIGVVQNYKIKNFRFFIKPGKKAYVCFKPYELGPGGDSSVFAIQSKYQ